MEPDFADRLRDRAREIGFDGLGVAAVAGDGPGAEKYRDWIARGYHGTMTWMEREGGRCDPAALLPGARSVVVAITNYFHPDPPTASSARGVVSRYARGNGDYHGLVQKRLDALASWIRSRIGGDTKACVDTSAILERDWAIRAGLGGRGKHTLLLTREFSSWVFLGEILTTAEILPDAPYEKDPCGTCAKCIDICPTRAIVAPYVLDARRCIAYLTIENRGPIPREMREAMGNLVFGCDLCQEVCPWNRFAKESKEASFLPRKDLRAPLLSDLADRAGHTEAEFAAAFAGSPVRRARREGFLRNVAVALGNSQDAEAEAPLGRLLEDSSALVRAHAAWGLGRIGSETARARLAERRWWEDDAAVLEEINLAIGS